MSFPVSSVAREPVVGVEIDAEVADCLLHRGRSDAVGPDEGGEHGHDDIHDVGNYEWIAWTPLLVAIVVFGVYPQLMFKVMDPAVTSLFGK